MAVIILNAILLVREVRKEKTCILKQNLVKDCLY